ncbi:MAG TPA: response regulator [Gemmatimonadales bacterium]|nr:response regulator [Gemmatimonadales bacterium]HZH42137.1 response regulator [Gemmatimonadales bacterium]
MTAAATPTSVLVVDDEDSIRQALERFVSRLGYRAVMARDGITALERVAQNHFDLMLCDVRMPGVSGVELVPKVLERDPDVAILMLTAVDEPRTAVECLKLGAYDYLIKPVDLDELELAMRTALRRRQLEIERRELERWLASEVQVRTRELEERTAALEDVAFGAMAAAQGWPGADAAIRTLAKELGMTEDEVRKEIRVRGF